METMEYEIKDLEDYRNHIEDIIRKGSDEVITNGSIAHAVVVQSEILDNARVNHWPVNMYCGSFSIYQDKTRDEVNIIVPKLTKPENSDKHPYFILLKSLSNFFEAGGHMNVITANHVSGLSNQTVWQYIKKPLENGQLSIKVLRDAFTTQHFTVAGEMYRRETSQAQRGAFCCFKSPKAEILKKAFDVLSTYSVEMDVR